MSETPKQVPSNEIFPHQQTPLLQSSNAENGTAVTDTTPSQEKTLQEIVLATNPTLDAICDSLIETPPDWNYLTESLETLLVNKPSLIDNALQGKVGELDMSHRLESVVSSSGFQNLCDLNPLGNTQTDNYKFRRLDGHQLLVTTPTNQLITEYDMLMIVDGLPTVVEVKSQERKRKGQEKRSLNFLINPATINERFAPLCEIFDTNTFGFVVLTSPISFKPTSPVQQDFIARGGKLIPAVIPRAEMRDRILAVRSRLSLQ